MYHRILLHNTSDSLLCSHKHKTTPQLQQELFNLRYQSLLQVAFQHRLVFRHTQKFKYIRIADNIGWLIDPNPFLRQSKNLFFIGVPTRQQQALIKEAVDLTLQFADRPTRKMKACDVNMKFSSFGRKKADAFLRTDNRRSHQLKKRFRFPKGELHSHVVC